MDAPFVVLRQPVSGNPAVPGVVTTLTISEFLDWYHNAMATMRLALDKNPQADSEVRATFQDALRAGPQKGHATIYAYLLWDAYRREKAMRAQTQVEAQAQAQAQAEQGPAPQADDSEVTPPIDSSVGASSPARSSRARVVSGCVPRHDPTMVCPDCDDGGG